MTGLLVASLGALAGLLLLRRCFLVVTVRGPSMEPTFHDGDRVLVARWRPIRRNSVVVVAAPERDPRIWPGQNDDLLIKRVHSVPGDRVPREEFAALADHVEDVVPVGSAVLRGDNRAHSYDSAQVGYFSIDHVRGVVLRRMER